MLRVGQESGQGWPTDEEVREILRNYQRVSGTVYGTHYAICYTHKEMVPTPEIFPETPGDTAQVELCEHNPFASRSMLISTASLPTQLHAVCDAEGDPLGHRAAYSRSREWLVNFWWKDSSANQLTPWSQQPMNNHCHRLEAHRLWRRAPICVR